MIQLHNIRCIFGETVAVDDVSLDLPPGIVLGLLGENGAGKSTLVGALYGAVRPARGRMELDGRSFSPRGPRDALRRGIGMVHQHFMLVPTLTVAENVVLGTRRSPWLSHRRLNDEIDRFARSAGLPIPPAARVASLSVGARQRVEILKVLYRQVRVLILDEPTAVLTPDEADELFVAMRDLRRRGVTVIFISHKLHEVVGHCDRVAVLRRGRLVHSGVATDVSPAALAELMVGQTVSPAQRKPRLDVHAPPALELRGVRVAGLERADLTLRHGEILGIAGVDGNGQDELARVVTGRARPDAGEVRVAGMPVFAASTARPAPRVAHIPNDRQRDGLALRLSVVENAVLTRVASPEFARFGWLRRAACAEFARGLVRDFDIRAASLDAPVATLSGGNQQKLVVGRELSAAPALIVAHNPTRGVDVAATAFIRGRLLAATERGAAVLLIGSDLDEITAMSDRIAVLYRGRLTHTAWPACELRTIGRLMAGLEAG